MPLRKWDTGGGSILNPDGPSQTIGLSSAGVATPVTSGAANTKGSWTSIGTIGAACAYIILCIGPNGATTHRNLIDVSFDGGVTTHVSNLFTMNSTAQGFLKIKLPLNVPAAAAVQIRMSSNGAGNIQSFYCIGLDRTAGSPPNYTSLVALNPDASNSRPGTPDVPMTDTWTQLVASTAAAYGGLLAAVGDNGTTPVNIQSVLLSLGSGAGGAETLLASDGMWTSTVQPFASRPLFSALFEKSIPAGTRLAAKITAAITGDSVRIGLYGLVA